MRKRKRCHHRPRPLQERTSESLLQHPKVPERQRRRRLGKRHGGTRRSARKKQPEQVEEMEVEEEDVNFEVEEETHEAVQPAALDFGSIHEVERDQDVESDEDVPAISPRVMRSNTLKAALRNVDGPDSGLRPRHRISQVSSRRTRSARKRTPIRRTMRSH